MSRNLVVAKLLQKRTGMSGKELIAFQAADEEVLQYATEAELLADPQDEGIIGYAQDTKAFFRRTGGTWTASNPFAVLTEGSVSFVGAGGVTAEDNANFFYDFATKRFGIGTNTPANALDIAGAIRITADSVLSGPPGIATTASIGFFFQAGSGTVADFSLATASGQRVLDIIAGTNNLFLQPTSSGTVRVGSTVRVDQGLSAFGATPPASQPGAIADASGGATVDSEARTAINALLAVMRANGLINT